jgi:hypothetical protein
MIQGGIIVGRNDSGAELHGNREGRGISTIGKCGAKFKILKCSKQTLHESFSPAIYLIFICHLVFHEQLHYHKNPVEKIFG